MQVLKVAGILQPSNCLAISGTGIRYMIVAQPMSLPAGGWPGVVGCGGCWLFIPAPEGPGDGMKTFDRPFDSLISVAAGSLGSWTTAAAAASCGTRESRAGVTGAMS